MAGPLFLALTWLLFFALLSQAWRHRFVQDDAFIAFRYADHMARGFGLVFNAGERVEGYTCFLYVLLVGFGMRLGLDPVGLSYAIGLTSFAATLWAAYHLGVLVCSRRAGGLLTMMLLGLNPSVSAYATGGLETSLQTALITGTLWIGMRWIVRGGAGVSSLAAISLLATLAIMTRLDSVVPLIPIGVALLVLVRSQWATYARSRLAIVALFAPATILLGGWIAWKASYYGDLLPNTYYAKATGGSPLVWARGIYYVHRFLSDYWLETLVVLTPFFVARARDEGGLAARVLLFSLSLWVAYVIWVGGDFMEYRLLVPLAPILFAMVVRTCLALQQQVGAGAAAVLVILGGNLHYGEWRPLIHYADGIESISHLSSHLTDANTNWVGVGRVLGRAFSFDPGVSIATTANGAIPYYSRLSCVDMLGLTDRWVARHGVPLGIEPGHRRVAPLRYLRERGVNLVIGHPDLLAGPEDGAFQIKRSKILRLMGLVLPEDQELALKLRAVAIPISSGWQLFALYLTPSERVDRVIARNGWKLYPVHILGTGRASSERSLGSDD